MIQNYFLHHILPGHNYDLPESKDKIFIRAKKEQKLIGEEHILYGKLTKSWLVLHKETNKWRNLPGDKEDLWTRRIIRGILEFTYGKWKSKFSIS